MGLFKIINKVTEVSVTEPSCAYANAYAIMVVCAVRGLRPVASPTLFPPS